VADASLVYPAHGGDLAQAEARYGLPAAGWLDLSTGINPRPWPAPDLRQTLQRLPAAAELKRLLAVARQSYGVPANADLVAVPGSDLAIRLLPLAMPEGDVAIVSPTYGSHAEAWTAAGRTVLPIASLEDAPLAASIIIAGNPNNPDGRCLDVGRFSAAVGGGTRIVVDEAFADLMPPASVLGTAFGASAVVLRSFGKFFGLAGLRLGFVSGPPEIIGKLRKLLGDWPVSGPAIAVGTAALLDTNWQVQTRTWLAEEAIQLRQVLTTAGLRIVGRTDLFVLTEHSASGAIHAGLARQGIWTRAFAHSPNWLRMGLPPSAAQRERFAAALDAVMADLSPSTE
jgi:cobalamin biosynthetic protein CobC